MEGIISSCSIFGGLTYMRETVTGALVGQSWHP